MTSMTTALSSLQATSTRLENAANNIANLNTPGFRAQEPVQINDPSGVQVTFTLMDLPANPETSNVDLTAQIVELDRDKLSVALNIAVIHSQDSMTQSLLDIMA